MKSIAIIEADEGFKLTELDVLEGIAKKVGTWRGIKCLSKNFKMSFTDLHTECSYCPQLHVSHAARIVQLQKMREDCANAMKSICDQMLTLQEWEKMNDR